MSEFTGVEARDVVLGAAVAAVLPLCVAALAWFASIRRRPRLRFACYWILLVYSAGLVTSALVNLALLGSAPFWLAAGGTGVAGLLVTFLRGPALWRAERDADERTVSVPARVL